LNLTDVSAGDYELMALPVKLRGADGAPARVVLRG
jgi:arylformamidase